MAVKPIPEGFHTITPYLAVKDAERLVAFLAQAFGAQEVHRTVRADNTIGHAQLKIGDSFLMLAEAAPPWNPTTTSIYLYVPDTDATYQSAIAAGGVSLMEPADMFYGDRNAGVQDSAGNMWWIATRVEDISPDELARRAAAAVR